jgi:type I restriction enzyme S subunit
LCFILTPKDAENFPIDLKFYYLIFRELRKDIVKNTKAGTSKEAISLGNFAKYKLPYFDIEKQNEIKNRFVEAEGTKENLATELNHQLALVKELRQAYLREAMQGKLVRQDSTDEPAEILLEKIKAEKEKLAAEKRIRRDKPLPPINAEEIPFEIPSNWTWCKGEIVADYIDPQPSHRTPPVSSNGVPYIAMSDIKADGKLDFHSARKVSFEILKEHQERYELKSGDFIFGKIGTIGKPVLLPQPFNYTLSANLILIQPKRGIILDKYLFFFLSSPIAEKELKDKKSTTSYPVFGMGKARNMLIPLPPLAEQERIVAKLEKLMKFCDELDSNIKQGIANADQLLQTALKEALEPKEYQIAK